MAGSRRKNRRLAHSPGTMRATLSRCATYAPPGQSCHRRRVHCAGLRPTRLPLRGPSPHRMGCRRHHPHRPTHPGLPRRQPLRRTHRGTMASPPPLRRRVPGPNTLVPTKIGRSHPTTPNQPLPPPAQTGTAKTRRRIDAGGYAGVFTRGTGRPPSRCSAHRVCPSSPPHVARRTRCRRLRRPTLASPR
jgi:hypothetical protein